MALELPVLDFIKTRLTEADPTIEVRVGTAYYDLFVKPQQLMLQPLLTALEVSLTAQSVLRIKNTSNPDSFDTDLVDQLTENLYVFRDTGKYATAIVRVYYSSPVDKQFPATTAEFLTSNGLSYFNSTDVTITQAEMVLNVSGDLYYVDVPVQAQYPGSTYSVDIGGIVAFVNDLEAIRVENLAASTTGSAAETNTQVLSRVEQSIGVRDFETGKGIVAIINQKFPGIFSSITSIGLGDPEMQRDIVYNAHVGGCTDVYLLTPALQQLSQNFVGLVFDETRRISNISHKQITATSTSDPAASLGTPYIVVGSVKVTDSSIPTSASFQSVSVPAVTGINLTGKEFIKLKLDATGSFINIKISGANVASTQRFEIINSINLALGQVVAKAYGVDQIVLVSQLTGSSSSLSFATPDAPRTDGTLTLFPSLAGPPYGYVSGVTGVGLNPAVIISGTSPVEYIETVDYQIDYENGLITKLPGSAIISGDTIAGPAVNGSILIGTDTFTSPIPGAFSLVEPGDELVVTSSTSLANGIYVIKSKTDNQTVRLQGVVAPSSDAAVAYYVTSQQTSVITYLYNPLSIDIGNQVLLSDGRTRGVRPGRTDYTLNSMPFLDVISIDEVDPDTLEDVGNTLSPTMGYGYGGYGLGGYGVGLSGDYSLVVNSPKERFSMFEDSVLVFNQSLFGRSYRVTYYSAPEIAEVHDLSRSDLERVTGADVLAKNYVPGFVDINLVIKRDPTNINTPANGDLVTMVKTYINSVAVGGAVDAADIVRILEDQGVDYVVSPFNMTLEVVNTDGSNTILVSQNRLILPDITLASQTPNYVTRNIMHFYARNITLSEV